MNGVVIIDKPAGLTSHDVVNRARRILGQRSVGHLGTLDPMATGVLPLVVGSLTRLAQFYTTSEKCYEGTIRFGFATDTYDAQGQPTSAPQPVSLRTEEVEALATRFRGIIEQMPPPFSAKKIQGVPAYKLARKQKEVILKPVKVEIKEFEISAVEADRVHFRARVASGTYMRSVAHEMGQALGCGAHLESLRRTAVAEFKLEDSHTLEELAEAAGKDQLAEAAGNSSLSRADDQPPDPSREAAKEYSPQLALSLSKGRKPWVADDTEQAPEGRKNSTRTNSEETSNGSLRTTSPEGTPENSPPVLLAGKPQAYDERPGGTPEMIEDIFFHPRKLLPQFPSVTVDESAAARIRAGRTVNLPELSRARQVKVFQGQRDLIAIATRVAGTLFHPKIVLVGDASTL
jgi:tRNA pseudouridine55 synthase